MVPRQREKPTSGAVRDTPRTAMLRAHWIATGFMDTKLRCLQGRYAAANALKGLNSGVLRI